MKINASIIVMTTVENEYHIGATISGGFMRLKPTNTYWLITHVKC